MALKHIDDAPTIPMKIIKLAEHLTRKRHGSATRMLPTYPIRGVVESVTGGYAIVISDGGRFVVMATKDLDNMVSVGDWVSVTWNGEVYQVRKFAQNYTAHVAPPKKVR